MNSKFNSIVDALGITNTAAEIYIFLLEHGSEQTSILRSLLAINKTKFYRGINELKEEKLIEVSGSPRNQKISIVDPNVLENLLDQKSRNIEEAQQSLSSLRDQLRALKSDRYQQENIEVISGANSYLRSMQEIIKGDGKVLRSISPDSAQLYTLAGSKTAYNTIVKEIKNTRKTKKIDISILLDSSALNLDNQMKTNIKDLKKVRKFPGQIGTECFLNTCGDRTLFFTQSFDGCWGLVITDKLITSLINSLFDVLWAQSEEC